MKIKSAIYNGKFHATHNGFYWSIKCETKEILGLHGKYKRKNVKHLLSAIELAYKIGAGD